MNNNTIINLFYGHGRIHPQPCSECGKVECAVCMEGIDKLMKAARKSERQKLIKKLTKLFDRADDTVWLSDCETMYDAILNVFRRVKV